MEKKYCPAKDCACGCKGSSKELNGVTPIDKAESQRPCTAYYLLLSLHEAQPVLQLGLEHEDMKELQIWCWSVHWPTGEAGTSQIIDTEPYEAPLPTFHHILQQIERWAHDGDQKAMWWLGVFYEYGSEERGANGGKALAYYLAAIRRDINACDRSSINYVLHEGLNLFHEERRADVMDKTPHDVCSFLARFNEYQSGKSKLPFRWPVSMDWQECVAIAEGLQ